MRGKGKKPVVDQNFFPTVICKENQPPFMWGSSRALTEGQGQLTWTGPRPDCEVSWDLMSHLVRPPSNLISVFASDPRGRLFFMVGKQTSTGDFSTTHVTDFVVKHYSKLQMIPEIWQEFVTNF